MIHGTVAGYKRHGCRCDECRAASRDYLRSYRAGLSDEKRAERRAREVEYQRRRRRAKQESAGKPPEVERGTRCSRCGIDYGRCKPASGRDVCIDCHDVELDLAAMELAS